MEQIKKLTLSDIVQDNRIVKLSHEGKNLYICSNSVVLKAMDNGNRRLILFSEIGKMLKKIPESFWIERVREVFGQTARVEKIGRHSTIPAGAKEV
jgi:hypothetical protein